MRTSKNTRLGGYRYINLLGMLRVKMCFHLEVFFCYFYIWLFRATAINYCAYGLKLFEMNGNTGAVQHSWQSCKYVLAG
jgi:hypothetical protein